MQLSLYSVVAIIILDQDGKRLFAKYYSPPHDANAVKEFASVKEELAFEKGLFAKTNKQNSEVIIYDSRVVTYKQVADVSIYVVGGIEESEVLLHSVLFGLREALETLLNRSLDKRTILEHYDLVALAIDETVDGGIIIETDGNIIASRVSRAPSADSAAINIDLSEEGLVNGYNFFRNKLSQKLKEQFT